MGRRKARILGAALGALHYSGAGRVMAPLTGGVGAIFMLHRVRPESPHILEPNRLLKITPDFLEQVIHQVRVAGFEVLSLDEAQFRLVEGDFRPFVCFTLDDGYRDNLEYAYPIFKRHNLPFTVYVSTDYVDGHGDLWWLALEKVIVKVSAVDVKIRGWPRRLRCETPAQKDAAFCTIYRWLRSIEENDARAFVRELCVSAGFDPSSLCADVMLTWEEIRQMSADPLVTIGAHTRGHYALAKLTLSGARAEIGESMRRVERETGLSCRHFSYPYGDEASVGQREFELVKELNVRTAVTTRKGLIRRAHAQRLTELPRVALGGDYQNPRHVKALLSGAPLALPNLVPWAARRAFAVT